MPSIFTRSTQDKSQFPCHDCQAVVPEMQCMLAIPSPRAQQPPRSSWRFVRLSPRERRSTNPLEQYPYQGSLLGQCSQAIDRAASSTACWTPPHFSMPRSKLSHANSQESAKGEIEWAHFSPLAGASCLGSQDFPKESLRPQSLPERGKPYRRADHGRIWAKIAWEGLVLLDQMFLTCVRGRTKATGYRCLRLVTGQSSGC
jgi:hypothetical protein